jgi:hypothetical protein
MRRNAKRYSIEMSSMETHSLHKCAQSNVEYLQQNDLPQDGRALPPLIDGRIRLWKLRLTHVSSEVLHLKHLFYCYLWFQLYK